MVWDIIIVVVHWSSMTSFMPVFCIIVASWMDGLVEVMNWRLDRVVRVSGYRLGQDSLMVSVWIDIAVSFVVEWVLEVHLFLVDWVRVVVLRWCDDIDQAKTVDSPLIRVALLVVLVLSLWDVVMV